MRNQRVCIVSQVIRYIEEHLHGRLDLDEVSAALHYSKYHLHRMFTGTVGFTVHDYIRRRRLTESAKLLVFSEKPIMDIALMSGYESRQAFTDIFKAMYKTSPAKFRKAEEYYPLQLELCLKEQLIKTNLTKDDIEFAVSSDAVGWMGLVKLTVDGYPCLNENGYTAKLHQYIADRRALLLRDGDIVIGAAAYSSDAASIDFMAVHPQYRKLGVTKLFLDKLTDELLCGREITLTTYRAGDKADTGYREEYYRLGFAGRELLVEYGYPTQRFVLPPKDKEETKNDRNTEESAGGKF